MKKSHFLPLKTGIWPISLAHLIPVSALGTASMQIIAIHHILQGSEKIPTWVFGVTLPLLAAALFSLIQTARGVDLKKPVIGRVKLLDPQERDCRMMEAARLLATWFRLEHGHTHPLQINFIFQRGGVRLRVFSLKDIPELPENTAHTALRIVAPEGTDPRSLGVSKTEEGKVIPAIRTNPADISSHDMMRLRMTYPDAFETA